MRQGRSTTDEQLQKVVRTWTTTTLIAAVSVRMEALLHPFGTHEILRLKWPGIEDYRRDDFFPIVDAAEAELNRRFPKPTEFD